MEPAAKRARKETSEAEPVAAGDKHVATATLGADYLLARSAVDPAVTEHLNARRHSDAMSRLVEPYLYTHATGVKQRWLGRRLLDVFADEFAASHPRHYFAEAIRCGLLRVNGASANADMILREGHRISHIAHVHEPDVPATPITVLHEDEHVVVVAKPAGVPVHPCASRRYNSLLSLMIAEHGATVMLQPVHRLDRLTSGVIILAKPAQKAGARPGASRGGKSKQQHRLRNDGSRQLGEASLETAGADASSELATSAASAAAASASIASASAASQSAARALCEDIRYGRMLKRYLACVVGEFPLGPAASDSGVGLRAEGDTSPAVAPAATAADAASVAASAIAADANTINAIRSCGCRVCSLEATAFAVGGAAASDCPFLSTFRPAMTGPQAAKELGGDGGEGEGLSEPPVASSAGSSSSPIGSGGDGHSSSASSGSHAAAADTASGAGAAAESAKDSPVRWRLGWRCQAAVAGAGYAPPAWDDSCAELRATSAGATAAAAASAASAGGSLSSSSAAFTDAASAAAVAVASDHASTLLDSDSRPGCRAGAWLQADIAVVAVNAKETRQGAGTDTAAAGKAGRESVTLFRRLAFDAVRDVSLVECRPLHGRSHQIRVHLAWLGHAIVDDPLYWPPALAALHAQDATLAAAEASAATASFGAGAAAVPGGVPPVAGSSGSAAGDSGSASGSESAISSGPAAFTLAALSTNASGPSLSASDDVPALAESRQMAMARALCTSCTKGVRHEFNVMQRLCRGISLHSWSYCRRTRRNQPGPEARDADAAAAVPSRTGCEPAGTAASAPAPASPTPAMPAVSWFGGGNWVFTAPPPQWALAFVN